MSDSVRDRILRKLARGKRRTVRGIVYRDITLTQAEMSLLTSIVKEAYEQKS